MDRTAVPVDDAQVNEHTFIEDDYNTADTAARQLRDQILSDPSAKASYDTATAEIERHQLTLAKLRRARALAQATVAEAMDMQQSEVSRLERRADFLLSTLRKFVEATGGELVIVARYPEGEVEVIPPTQGQPETVTAQ